MNGFELLGSKLTQWLRPPPDVPRSEPRSLVRVLHDEDELNEAIERAIQFDRRAAESAERRIDSYKRARAASPVVRLPTAPNPSSDGEGGHAGDLDAAVIRDTA